jgi:signal transduction histidine kinase
MSPRRTLLGFGAALLVVLGGVAWISTLALRLDRAALDAREKAAVEENVRLALWRLDSALLPLVSRESARSPAEYQSRSSSIRWQAEHVRLFFQLEPGGAIGSPELADPGRREEAARRLAELARKVPADRLLAALPASTAVNPAANPRLNFYPAGSTAQQEKNDNEWQVRSASVGNVYKQNKQAFVAGDAAPPAENVAELTPVWVSGELLLLRRARLGGPEVVQGAWLDWPEIPRVLPSTVADLLPAARVEPLARADEDPQRRLATLPLRLVPGPVEVKLDGQRSSVLLVLGVAWAGLLLAAAAVIALMAGTLALSERRAAFVSAVTHELRTPLTTLQTYSEMLVGGKITDPPKRQRYLETLHREALRLGHLVENVLAYSGIERGRRQSPVEPLAALALLARLAERLGARAAEAGLQLEVAPAPESLVLRGDAGAIEQILFNLIDNACKYGRRAGGRIHVSAAVVGSRVEIGVRDDGPGIPGDVLVRLFEPFSKSAEQAAGTAPGVGLGLALSRRLARAMGGDLRLDPAGPGAHLVLTLRAAAG